MKETRAGKAGDVTAAFHDDVTVLKVATRKLFAQKVKLQYSYLEVIAISAALSIQQECGGDLFAAFKSTLADCLPASFRMLWENCGDKGADYKSQLRLK